MKTTYILALVVVAVLIGGCGSNSKSVVEAKIPDGGQGTTISTTSDGADDGVTIVANSALIDSSLPAAGAKDIQPNTTISVVLSDEVDFSIVGAKNILVLVNGAQCSGDVLVNESTLIFTPIDPLPYDSLVTVSVHDLMGVGNAVLRGVAAFSFTTVSAPDVTAPFALSSVPADADADVAKNSSISVKLSEDVTEDANAVMTDGAGNEVPGALSYNKAERIFTFIPDVFMPSNSAMTFSLKVTDLAGITSDVKIDFTTAADADVTPPAAPVLTFANDGRATVNWLAVGDDGDYGEATSYVMKRSSRPIDSISDFDAAETLTGLRSPKIAGEVETFTMRDVGVGESVYLALRVFDESGNASEIASAHFTSFASTTFLAEATAENAANDSFGYSVAGKCDINGDGVGDYMVGAFGDDSAGVNVGRVFVYFGSSDVVLTVNGFDSYSLAGDDYFGFSTSCDHDFNGDGFDDILIGMPNEDTLDGAIYSLNSGAAFLFYGKAFDESASISANAADVKFQGRTANDRFGYSVAGVGDLNKDGYDDIAITAPWSEIVNADEGVVNVFFGGDLPSGTKLYDIGANIKVAGVAAGSSGGLYGVKSGDIDGDGIIDLIFAAGTYPATNKGAIYVWLGKHGFPSYIDLGTSVPDVTINGETNGDNLGTYAGTTLSISADGDMNGDGISDLVIGDANYDVTGAANAGAVFVYFGRESWNSSYLVAEADMRILGAMASDSVGSAIDSNGDYNNDGISDLLIGSAGFASGGGRGGAAIFFGGVSLAGNKNIFEADVMIGHLGNGFANVKLDKILASADLLGSSISFAGDVNGDGYDDLVVGAYGNEAIGRPVNSGAAYLIW